MIYRASFALLFTVMACGDPGEPSEDEELANASRLTRIRAQEQGDYCCYENGALIADAPAGCRNTNNCFFSETYSDLSPGGRGSMCGYLLCE